MLETLRQAFAIYALVPLAFLLVGVFLALPFVLILGVPLSAVAAIAGFMGLVIGHAATLVYVIAVGFHAVSQ
jgi:hypothetical protein